MVDFSIVKTYNSTALGFDKGDALENNVILSIQVAKGTFFVDPAFGSRLHDIRKITEQNLRLAENYAVESLRWLIDLKRIVTAEATAWKDEHVSNRINMTITVTRPDETESTFETYYRVV